MIITSEKFASQPQYAAPLADNIPQPDAVLLPSVGLVNAGGKSASRWTATSGISLKPTAYGMGFSPASTSDGIWIPSDASVNGDVFSVLLSCAPAALADSRAFFQWAGTGATSGSPYLIIQNQGGLLRVWWAGGYRIQSSSSVFATGRRTNIVVRGNGSEASAYVHGARIGIAALAGTNTRTHAWFCNGFGGSMVGHANLVGAVWNDTDIGATLAQELSVNPWGLFRAPSSRLWPAVDGGAVSGDTVGSSSGVATVSGVGASVAETSGSSAGVATVSGVGSFSSEGGAAGSSSGIATVTGVGASVVETAGSAAGVATVSGVGSSVTAGSAVGSSSGSATVSGVGASVAAAVGLASGEATVIGRTPSVTPAQEEVFSGGYPVIDHKERKRKKRLELGIIEDGSRLKVSENKELGQKKAVLGPSLGPVQKKADLLAQQEALNAELKRLMQIELEQEEEAIVRLLMEL